MIKGGVHAFSGRRVLLLQGPLGPFFGRFARDLRHAGAYALQVNFNGGDWLFSGRHAVNFRGDEEEWPDYLCRLLDDHSIDTILLFGDCRPLHRIAHAVAQERGIEVGVFEEGYVRPNYVTFERFGVNGHSLIPRHPIFYLNSPIPPADDEVPVGNTYWHSAFWAVLYYAAAMLGQALFPHYRHHRPLGIGEAGRWIRSGWRKLVYRVAEAGLQEKLTGQLAKRFFLVPLQVHSDAQVVVHSDFDSVALFIEHLLDSFAECAPRDTYLVIKHHPYDRAYHDYAQLIRRHARALGVGRRVLYLHDQHLPSLLQAARGVVVINSTVGLQALHHGTPTKVCGVALYDLPGLTTQCGLDEFWTKAATERVDGELFRRFRDYLIHASQINGSFYRRLDIPGLAAGLAWRPRPCVSRLQEQASRTPAAISSALAETVRRRADG